LPKALQTIAAKQGYFGHLEGGEQGHQANVYHGVSIQKVEPGIFPALNRSASDGNYSETPTGSCAHGLDRASSVEYQVQKTGGVTHGYNI
jgi:hypothetical protein